MESDPHRRGTRHLASAPVDHAESPDQAQSAYALGKRRGVARSHPADRGSDVRDLIALSVEARLGGPKAERALEWLTDNGPPYVANECSHRGSFAAFTPTENMFDFSGATPSASTCTGSSRP